jgi:hypothetical protein
MYYKAGILRHSALLTGSFKAKHPPIPSIYQSYMPWNLSGVSGGWFMREQKKNKAGALKFNTDYKLNPYHSTSGLFRCSLGSLHQRHKPGIPALLGLELSSVLTSSPIKISPTKENAQRTLIDQLNPNQTDVPPFTLLNVKLKSSARCGWSALCPGVQIGARGIPHLIKLSCTTKKLYFQFIVRLTRLRNLLQPDKKYR